MPDTPPPPTLPTQVQRYYVSGIPTPDQVRYETSLHAWLRTRAPIVPSGEVDLSANPPATNSGSYICCGLALTFGPTSLTKAWVTADGMIYNGTNNGETRTAMIYGSGTPPAYGTPFGPGHNVIGQALRFIATGGGGTFAPFSMTRVASGLQANTKYWFDMILVGVSGSTAMLNGLTICAQGLS